MSIQGLLNFFNPKGAHIEAERKGPDQNTVQRCPSKRYPLQQYDFASLEQQKQDELN